jgi:hypothetical protein
MNNLTQATYETETCTQLTELDVQDGDCVPFLWAFGVDVDGNGTSPSWCTQSNLNPRSREKGMVQVPLR